MASAIRFKAVAGLAGLSRAIPRAHANAFLCRRSAIDTQRRLFHRSSILNGEEIVVVPPMAESLNEGTLASLTKKIGETIEADEELASIETDKIDISIAPKETGVVVEYFAAEGDTVVVGQDLARVVTGGDAGAAKSEGEAQQPPKEEPKQETKPSEPAKAEENHTKEQTPPHEPPKPEPAAPASAFTGGPARTERVEKMSRMRRTIASRLKQSQNTCASLTTIQEVDMTNLMAWRSKYKEEVAEKYAVRLGYMGAFTKATTLAALQVPQVNAAIDTDKEITTWRDYVDISIAVSAPKGLITPVLRNTHTLSIVELEREVAALAKKARDAKLTMEDLEGGNYSISNPGIFGSMFGTPVINYPQSAVFNMNGIQQRVMAINGQAEIRPMMYISLTYDHRLIDGREAVSFLNIVKQYIEDPSRMLLA